MISRKLTCLYIEPLIFLFTFGLKYPNKYHSQCILYQNFNSFNFPIWVGSWGGGGACGFINCEWQCDGEQSEGNEWNAGV